MVVTKNTLSLQISNNTDYGGILITEKYAPLLCNLEEWKEPNKQKDIDLCLNAWHRRIEALKKLNLFPAQLEFYSSEKLNNQEAALTPIVVPSSSRSAWIAEQIYNYYYNHGGESNNLFWYQPNKVKYIFVNYHEYDYYTKILNRIKKSIYDAITIKEINIIDNCTALKNLNNLKVVGWKFKKLQPGKELNTKLELVGFGATRFAAIEFCKYLSLKKVWMVDDNVFGVVGFSGFTQLERNMESKQDLVALSFIGTANIVKIEEAIDKMSAKSNKQEQEKDKSLEIQSDRNKREKQSHKKRPITESKPQDPQPSSVKANPSSILQQCVLWNIDKITELGINFSPYFISSSEDVSLSYYLSNLEQPKKATTEIYPNSIVKILTYYDTDDKYVSEEVSKGAEQLKLLRKNIEEYCSNLIGEELYIDRNNLKEYIRLTVLPNSKISSHATNPIAINKATSQAIEELIYSVVKESNIERIQHIFKVPDRFVAELFII